jgi:hypothetical protein
MKLVASFEALFPGVHFWIALVFIFVVLAYVAVQVITCMWKVRHAGLKSAFKEHRDLVRIAQTESLSEDVVRAQAAHGIEQYFDRHCFARAASAIELVPTASLALTVYSLYFVIGLIDQGAAFNEAFSEKLLITVCGMVLFIALEMLIGLQRARFSKLLDHIRLSQNASAPRKTDKRHG